ncbi:MAG: Major facilitator superfamily transporter [Streptosporangiaceae bacterium]|jgi:MFS family permease|nr:Major facilitator superfamily transporter [Streptosporangiaceae bacterium]
MSTPLDERLPLWKLSGPQRLLEAGALLNSIAFFAAMPFAALYLADHTSLSKPAIGAVVGGIALTAALGGVAGGMLVDRFGATRLMRVGLALDVIVYGLLATLRSPVAIVTLILMLGVARLMVEPGSKKLLSLAAHGDARVFRLRYMTLCTGAIAGPALGGVLYHLSPVAFFAVPAVFYGAYMVLISARSQTLTALESPSGASTGSSLDSLRKTVRDRRLLAVVGAGIVIFFVFSQLESMIPLYMKGQYGDRTESYFAVLFIANAVLALALQVPIDRVSTKLTRNSLIALGCVMFALSFVCFWAGSAGLLLLYVGIVFWTIGEGILLPMPDMAVHEIAADEHRGAYFGLSEVRHLGFFGGPVVGGFLLAGDVRIYFLVMGLFIFLCLPLLMRRSAAPAEDASKASEELSAHG